MSLRLATFLCFYTISGFITFHITCHIFFPLTYFQCKNIFSRHLLTMPSFLQFSCCSLTFFAVFYLRCSCTIFVFWITVPSICRMSSRLPIILLNILHVGLVMSHYFCCNLKNPKFTANNYKSCQIPNYPCHLLIF